MNIQAILDKVSVTNYKYSELTEISGDNYNIFRILKMESSEVRMHSAFLANLLDPNGSHGLKDTFLKSFIEKCKIPGYENISKIKATVIVEEYIGAITEDYTSGGRIDIVIKPKNGGKTIIIENKIYAGDQTMQLIRYKENYPNAHLLYLTLDGKEPCLPSIESIDKTQLKKDTDYYCISYRADIFDWLIECQKESVRFPLLRETISQYKNLIKYLTGQTMNEEMKMRIVSDIILSSENIESAEIIAGLWEQVKLNILDELKQDILNTAKILNLEVFFHPNTLGKKDSGFWFYSKDWKKYCIYFSFNSNFETLLLGISTQKEEDKIDIELKDLIEKSLAKNNYGKILRYSNWMWVCNWDEWNEISWKDVKINLPIIITTTVGNIMKDLKGINL